MRDKNILAPLIRALDRVVFGIEEPEERENKKSDFIEIDTEEEFDVERSIN